MEPQPFTAAWLVMLLIATGAAVIGYLTRRMLEEHKESLDEHDRDITALKVDVAKALSGNEATAEQLRVLRHDVRDIKQGVDGIASHIMQLLGRK